MLGVEGGREAVGVFLAVAVGVGVSEGGEDVYEAVPIGRGFFADGVEPVFSYPPDGLTGGGSEGYLRHGVDAAVEGGGVKYLLARDFYGLLELIGGVVGDKVFDIEGEVVFVEGFCVGVGVVLAVKEVDYVGDAAYGDGAYELGEVGGVVGDRPFVYEPYAEVFFDLLGPGGLVDAVAHFIEGARLVAADKGERVGNADGGSIAA